MYFEIRVRIYIVLWWRCKFEWKDIDLRFVWEFTLSRDEDANKNKKILIWDSYENLLSFLTKMQIQMKRYWFWDSYENLLCFLTKILKMCFSYFQYIHEDEREKTTEKLRN